MWLSHNVHELLLIWLDPLLSAETRKCFGIGRIRLATRVQEQGHVKVLNASLAVWYSY